MNREELRGKIKVLVKQIYKDRINVEKAAVEYDELTKFPELKDVIVSLLGPQFDAFVASIDWVAPKPTTFRINLKNGENFYLVFTERSWIAEVEGKKYYLLNLNEEENAVSAIARVLSYGNTKIEDPAEAADTAVSTGGGDFPGGEAGGETGGDEGGAEEVDVTVDDEVDVEI